MFQMSCAAGSIVALLASALTTASPAMARTTRARSPATMNPIATLRSVSRRRSRARNTASANRSSARIVIASAPLSSRSAAVWIALSSSELHDRELGRTSGGSCSRPASR